MKKIDIAKIKEDFPKSSFVEFEVEKFDYYILDSENIHELEHFLDIISKSSAHHLYVRNPLQENIQIYDRGGLFVGVYEKNKLIALMISDILTTENEIFQHLNIDETRLKEFAILDTIAVLPDYRGFSLQTKLMCIFEYLGLQNGNIFGLSTVSPNNYHSLKNFFKQNYVLTCLAPMYAKEGKSAVMRYIASLELGKILEEVPEQYSVVNSDIEAQQNVLSLGFVGMKIVNAISPEKFFISFSKAFYNEF